MILVDNVSYVYNKDDKDKRFCALKNINFTIKDGEFVSIIGHSGCGKSTLLKVFAGLFQPTEGEIYIYGKKMQGPDTRRAVVFQDYSLFPWMTVLKNVMFGIWQREKCQAGKKWPAQKKYSKKEIRQMAMEYLKKVNMAQAARKYPFQLSGGMRQRVAIARALAMNADILLLDEPFGALDARNRRELQDMMLRFRQEESKKKTVIFVTHDIEEAILLSDRILFMRPGEMIADYSVPALTGQYRSYREELLGNPEYQSLKMKLLGLFYMDTDQREMGTNEKAM